MTRLTLNLGLRYEYLRAYSPVTDEPAGFPLYQPIQYPEVDCLPCWHDLSPRMAAVYDLFGNGRTAIKAGLGRYVESLNSAYASSFGPANAVVVSTTRAWTDPNGDFYPNCDLANVTANGECAAVANSSFGQTRNNSATEEGFMTGFGNRGYNWQASLGIDQELRPGVAVQAAYYRRWFGNFTVVDNTLVTPADYDPYCVTAPTDERLGSISGSQICGLYDLNPAKFGQQFNVTGLSDKFGKETEVYNGFDLNVGARFGNGGTVSGGWNLGNTFVAGSVSGVTFSKSNRCYVVDSPQQLYNCESGNPYQSRFRFNGSYPMPWGFQVAGVYQSLPGASYSANYTYTTAQAQAGGLGRPLSGGARNATIDLLPRGSSYLDQRINQLDLRFTKMFRFQGRNRLQANMDVYNLFNGNTPLQVNQTYGDELAEADAGARRAVRQVQRAVRLLIRRRPSVRVIGAANPITRATRSGPRHSKIIGVIPEQAIDLDDETAAYELGPVRRQRRLAVRVDHEELASWFVLPPEPQVRRDQRLTGAVLNERRGVHAGRHGVDGPRADNGAREVSLRQVDPVQ